MITIRKPNLNLFSLAVHLLRQQTRAPPAVDLSLLARRHEQLMLK